MVQYSDDAGGVPVERRAAAGAGAAVALPDIVQLDAIALAGAIRAKRVSCVEVMTAYLDHIEALNPQVNAIVALQDREALLRQAAERDAEYSRGQSIGPLHGFPHAVKDLHAVRGICTTQGSPLFKNFIPLEDSPMVDRLRRAGAIFIGKTNTPEFGLGSHTYNPVYGITRNAYDQSRSAGGSSGGAAVALALRMVPLADGSDYGGSLRNPAGWNNVFGFRTSFGCVPSDSPDQWLPSMGVLGPMARTVPDLAMLLSVQAGYDARAPLSMDGAGSRFRGRLQRDLKGKRIAWGGDFGGFAPHEPGVLEVCRQALKTFESLGCDVDEDRPDHPPEPVWEAALRLRAWQLGGALEPYCNAPETRALLKPEAVYEVELGRRQSAFDVSAASAIRTEWYQSMRRFFERYDYFIIPTAQVFPFDAGVDWPREIDGRRMATYHEWMKATLLVSMSGCPALAAPAGFNAAGLPMGIQIVGPNRSELGCLQMAYAYELATDWTHARPPPLLQ